MVYHIDTMEIPSENFMSISKKMRKTKLIAGRSNPELAKGISEKLDIPLTPIKITDFGNTELDVAIHETVREFHVFVIQTGGFYQGRSVNDHLIELFAIIHACKLSGAKSINVIMPCYAYARSDKKCQSRVCVMASCIAPMFQQLGVKRIVSMDLHAGQIQGFYQIPMDNIYGINLLIENFKTVLFDGLSKSEINDKYVLVAPDVGAAKVIEKYAKHLEMKHVIMHKHRDYDNPNVVFNSILIGESDSINNKTVIIIDDIVDSFGTMNAAVNTLIKHGAKNAIVVATHGLYSGQAFEKINDNEFIEKIVVINTLPQCENLQKTSKLQVIDASETFAEVIKRLRVGNVSISELFI